MTVLLRDQAILHIPKTGGNWVRCVLEKSLSEDFVMICYSVSNPHLTIGELRALFTDHSLAENYLFLRNAKESLAKDEKQTLLSRFNSDKLPKFHAFIRHPLSWWISFWRYRQKVGWQTGHWIDSRCQSDHFSVFIENVLRFVPGAYSSMARDFIGSVDSPIDGVWKQESLLEDLSTILNEASIPFDEATLDRKSVV